MSPFTNTKLELKLLDRQQKLFSSQGLRTDTLVFRCFVVATKCSITQYVPPLTRLSDAEDVQCDLHTQGMPALPSPRLDLTQGKSS